MNHKTRDQILLVLMKKEIELLRSTLSEWDQDKSCYVTWIRANDLRSAIELLENAL